MSNENEVLSMLGEVLGLGERVQELNRDSALLGALPEFDSMAVVSVITCLEENFGLVIDDDDIEASTFETVGTLVDFVDSKLQG